MQEIWKDIPGIRGSYQASNLGRIKSLACCYKKISRGKTWMVEKKERILKRGWISNSGYEYTSLGSRQKKETHYWVLTAFRGPRPHKHVCNHKNGIKTDNRIENLEWVSVRSNVMHSRNTLMKKGKKINVDTCVEMIKLSHGGMLTKDIAKKFKMTRQGVSGIFTGIFWQSGDYPKIDEAIKKWPPRIKHERFNLRARVNTK